MYGCSRRGAGFSHPRFHDIRADLSDLDRIPSHLERLLRGVRQLDRVFLNAGILGRIQPLSATSMDAIREIMDINVWSNKVILDWLLNSGIPITQIIMISSGASILGNKGWGGYALSKSALNMLARLYSHEFPDTHISAIAPGLIDSAMMDYLCDGPDVSEYPALRRLRDARGTAAMPTPELAAEKIDASLPLLRQQPSGGYIDLREIMDMGEPVPTRGETS